MSKKLSRYIVEIEKTEKKIEELKEHLSNLRRKQKLDEDLEIVKSIRDIKMSSRELAEILDGIQNGSISFQNVSLPEKLDGIEPDEDDEPAEDTGGADCEFYEESAQNAESTESFEFLQGYDEELSEEPVPGTEDDIRMESRR
ncbi:MAG: DUF4315 family protein [Lachnospiraceae bacterium]|nr:DUF4315 family protein [Lachnospiraceae bacterium]